MRYLLYSVLVVLGTCHIARADGAAPSSVRDVVQRVHAGHPALRQFDGRAEAVGHAAERATAWPDPRAGLAYSNAPWTTPYPGEHPMTGIQLEVRQQIPVGGKLEARAAAIRAGIDVVRASQSERGNALAGRAVDRFHTLTLTRQLRALTAGHVELLSQLIEVVRVGYEVGRAPQHELVSLEVVRDRLRDDLSDFDRHDRELLASLNADMGRPIDGMIETPVETSLPSTPPSSDVLLARAMVSRPIFLRIVAESTAEVRGIERADAELVPDVTVGAAYRYRRPIDGGDRGEDFVSLSVSAPLPWLWNDTRWGEQAAAHRARRRALDAERAAVERQLRGQIEAARAVVERGIEKARVYRSSLIPEAHRALDSTFAAYRVGRADFGSVIQLERVLLDLERAERQARSDAARATSRLDMLTGGFAPSESAQTQKETR